MLPDVKSYSIQGIFCTPHPINSFADLGNESEKNGTTEQGKEFIYHDVKQCVIGQHEYSETL